MKFTDEGIIIDQKKYGENSLIVKVFSQQHGICRAFIKSAKSPKNRVIFQVGNLVSFEYRSRIEDNLGSFFYVDLKKSYCTKIIFDKLKLDCLNSLFSILDSCFLERETQPKLFEVLNDFLQKISGDEISVKDFLAKYIRLEIKILKTLGYGLDLSTCVVTNSKANLAFVSPKSACAVSFEAGAPYQNKLLRLPNFLVEDEADLEWSHLSDGFKLSGFFLEKFLFSERDYLQKNLFYRQELIRSSEKIIMNQVSQRG